MKTFATWLKQSFCFHWWSCEDVELYARPYKFTCVKCGKEDVA